jgi:4-hydroxy-tetrahydrodipicolinate synthase
VELYDLCRNGEWGKAMELQRQMWKLNQAFAKYNLAACIKGGLQLQGYPVGSPLSPQEPLPPLGIEEVKQALSEIEAL